MKSNFNKFSIILAGFISLAANAAVSADTTELTANFDSDYLLNIPANQTITDKNVNIGDLFVTGDIAPNQVVKVATETKQFERVGSNDVIPFTLKYNQSSTVLNSYDFEEAGILSGAETKIDLWTDISEVNWTSAKAGEYKGSIVFTASLVEK